MAVYLKFLHLLRFSQQAKIIPTWGASHTLFFKPRHPLSDGSLQPVALGVSHPVYRLWLGIPSHHPGPLVLSFNPLCAFQDLDFCSVLLTCPLLPAKTFCLTSVISLMEEESSVLYNTPQVLEQDLTRYKDSMTICQINNFQVQW